MRSPRFILPLVVLVPWTLTPALAATETVTVPLELRTITGKDKKHSNRAEYKLGIWLGLGGGARKLYEFDTGAPGLFAAKSSRWWPDFSAVNHPPIVQTYSSGNTYYANIVDTRVDFGHGIPVVRAHVAQIDSATGANLVNWDADLAKGKPPLYGSFFGDFGIDLGTNVGLAGLLPQLPGNLSSGFIVSTGGYSQPSPFLTIGLTDDMRAQFPSLVRMKRGKGFFPNASGERRRFYKQELIQALVSLKDDKKTLKFTTGVVLDTGAPTAEVHDLNNEFGLPKDWVKGDQIPLGVAFSMSHQGARGSAPWKMDFGAGNKAGFNAVDITQKVIAPHTEAYVNAGLVPFFRYEVMFDLKEGVVGFRPIRKGTPGLFVSGSPAYSVGSTQTVLSGTTLARAYLVERVEVKVGSGAYQHANGVKEWSAPITLASGPNTVTVRAVDFAGKATMQQLTITAP